MLLSGYTAAGTDAFRLLCFEAFKLRKPVTDCQQNRMQTLENCLNSFLQSYFFLKDSADDGILFLFAQLCNIVSSSLWNFEHLGFETVSYNFFYFSGKIMISVKVL